MGLEPATNCILCKYSANWATEAAQLSRLSLWMLTRAKVHVSLPAIQGNSNSVLSPRVQFNMNFTSLPVESQRWELFLCTAQHQFSQDLHNINTICVHVRVSLPYVHINKTTWIVHVHVHVKSVAKQLHLKTAISFRTKNELPQAGLEPATYCILCKCYQLLAG